MANLPPIKRAGGFTAIEILLALTIAGIIIMLAFQTIPVLQRNSRNNDRKQDVAAVLEAVSHWQLNHSGNIPNNPSDDFMRNAQLYYYDQTLISFNSTPATGIAINPQIPSAALIPGESNSSLDSVYIYNYRKCSPDANGLSTNRGAGYNDIVALYSIETRAGSVSQCREL